MIFLKGIHKSDIGKRITLREHNSKHKICGIILDVNDRFLLIRTEKNTNRGFSRTFLERKYEYKIS